MANLASRGSNPLSGPVAQERRLTPRARASTQVMVITMRGPIPARMLDVSLTGCRIRCEDLPKFAVSVRLAILSHGLELQAEQRWRQGDHSGWRFIYTAEEQQRLQAILRSQRVAHEPVRRLGMPFRSTQH
ncbi:PilZ domain-containing protein [Stappia sp.]|uniref:PilZ domain-containing protein n=1 Tax=Stappia sp. TaxID=1870903 RepID=UPI0032D8CDD1